jgi:ribose transport system substrate-binding protein
MAFALALGLVFAGGAQAEEKGLDNHARRDPYYEKLKGKKVILVSLAMGFDLTEGWTAIMRRQAKDLGYIFKIRDPK